MEVQTQVYLGATAIIASRAMIGAMDLAARAARTSATVLITGETGSGKEIVARAVHHYSLRCNNPWVDFNCGALSESLVESELFGHERGAFSGALSTKPGLFELAHTGTLFLDEVGELEPRIQVKLLRVLDGTPYYRVGGQRKIAVDARIVTATNRDLPAAVAAGRFRGDLYHRLNQCEIRVPPLRERREDIVAIAEFFLRQQTEQASFSEDAKRALEGYPWPGNVRELRNAVMHALIHSRSYVIGLDDLPPLRQAAVRELCPAPAGGLEAMEKDAILAALSRTGGHHQRTADLLGISRRTLTRKLRAYREELAEEAMYAG